MRISDWSSDVCSSDLAGEPDVAAEPGRRRQVVVAESLAGEPRAGGGDAGVVRGKAVVGTADRPFPASCCLEALRRAPGGKEGAAADGEALGLGGEPRSEEHTSELQSLMRTSYAVFCLKKKKTNN